MLRLIEAKLSEVYGSNFGMDRVRTHAAELAAMQCFVVQNGELRLKPSHRGMVSSELGEAVPPPSLSKAAASLLSAQQEIRDMGFR